MSSLKKSIEDVTDENKKLQIEKLLNQKSEIDNKIKEILRVEKEKSRKERTRNLIQIGAVVQKYFEVNTPEETQKFCEQTYEILKILNDKFNITEIQDLEKLHNQYLSLYKMYKQDQDKNNIYKNNNVDFNK